MIFGGYGTGFVASHETWEWDGAVWALRVTPNDPGVHEGGALAYDEERGAAILFGGTGAVSSLDTR